MWLFRHTHTHTRIDQWQLGIIIRSRRNRLSRVVYEFNCPAIACYVTECELVCSEWNEKNKNIFRLHWKRSSSLLTRVHRMRPIWSYRGRKTHFYLPSMDSTCAGTISSCEWQIEVRISPMWHYGRRIILWYISSRDVDQSDSLGHTHTRTHIHIHTHTHPHTHTSTYICERCQFSYTFSHV